MHRHVHFRTVFTLLCSIVLMGLFVIITISPISIGSPGHLDIPSQDDIRTHGYPTNQKGETYGPDVKELTDMPDLILVQSDNILGYVKASDLDDGVTSIADALSSNPTTRTIPVYLQDGTTVIGEFIVEPGEFTMG